MTEGTRVPAAAPPTDRFPALRSAQARHENAVTEYQEAQRLFLEAVNELQLPELMQGPTPRATDLTTIEQARTVLQLLDHPRADELLEELDAYRTERNRLAAFFGIADLAEVVAVTAAAVARAGRAGS